MTAEGLQAAVDALAEARPLLVATDYDGVLSPIVSDPAAAVPDPDALAAFLSVAAHDEVIAVIISGRSREALISFVGDPPGVELIGNHGADVGTGIDPETAATVGQIVDALRSLERGYAGSHVEPKPFGAAFHYRNASDRIGARDAARRVGEDLPGRVVEGSEVVEVVIGAATKGTAIARERSRTGAAAVLYIGDDITDEDVFRTLDGIDLGVKVGTGETVASHRVGTIAEVTDVFRTLERALHVTE
jgi:trehalose 6-phosphate phosphatase